MDRRQDAAWRSCWPGAEISAGALALRGRSSTSHARPFLAPLFSWSATLAGGTFSKVPDTVIILFEHVREEVARKPTRRLEPLLSSPNDIFRGRREGSWRGDRHRGLGDMEGGFAEGGPVVFLPANRKTAHGPIYGATRSGRLPACI